MYQVYPKNYRVKKTKTIKSVNCLNSHEPVVGGDNIDKHHWIVIDDIAEHENNPPQPSSSEYRLLGPRGGLGLAACSPPATFTLRSSSGSRGGPGTSLNTPEVSSSILETSAPNPVAADKWQRQVTTWEAIMAKFNLRDTRYREFEFLKYLDISDPFVENYVQYQLGQCDPLIKSRVRLQYDQWVKLNPPQWLLSSIREGIKLPFSKEPPVFVLPNNKSANSKDTFPGLGKLCKNRLNLGL